MPYFTNRGIVPLSAGGGAYVGPGDVATGAAWWVGLRAYSAAAATVLPAIRLVRSSDSAQADIDTLANGDLDVGDAFFNGSTYKVVTLYDQSGNGVDWTQSTDGLRPVFSLSGIGSKPIMTFTLASAHRLPSAAVVNLNPTVFSFSSYAKNTSATQCQLWSDSNNQWGYDRSGVDNAYIFNGNLVPSVAATDGVYHAVQSLYNNAASIIRVDSTSSTVDVGAAAPTNSGSTWGIGASPAGGEPFGGVLQEMGFWTSNQSANFAALASNQIAYWV